MIQLERANRSRSVTWLSLVGLILVPVIVAGGFLWAIWGSDTRLDRVQAAVVNLDEAVELNGQTVPLGRQFAAGLIDGGDDVASNENFSWNLTAADDAAAGLKSGRYAAVVTIPKNFSKAATSYSGDGDDAEQATIQVQTSQVTGIADSAIGQTIATIAVKTLNTTLTESYLDNIYLGFNDLSKQFGSITEGAAKLADGTEQLADGVGQSSDGAQQLSAGLNQLGTGGTELSTGATKLATGANQLASGGTTLDKGAKDFAGGVGQLNGQLPQLKSGTSQLASGTKQYAAGVKKYTDGVGDAADGVHELNTKLQAGLGSGLPSGGSTDELDLLTTGTQALSKSTSSAAKASAALAAQVAGLPEKECPEDLSVEACAGYKQALGETAKDLGDNATTAAKQAGTAAAIAPGLNTGVSGLVETLKQFSGLSSQLTELVKGVDELDKGMAQLKKNGSTVASGATSLSTGATELDSGVGELQTGVQKLATGANGLATGIDTYTDGVSSFSTGLGQYATGVKTYTDGVLKAAEGMDQFASGMAKLDTGATDLAKGSRTFATELGKGAGKVPTYDSTQRENLKTVVAAPVDNAQSTELLPEANSTSLLMVLALWLGGLATFLVVQAVPSRVLRSSRPSWFLALQAMLPGAVIAAVQALALTIVGQIVLDLSAPTVAKLFGLLLLIGFAFVGVNHALAAWLGGVGRILSVTAVVLTAAGAILSAVPALFDSVRPFLPLTPALDAVRSLVTGGSGTGGGVAMVVAWLLLAIAASVLAVLRRRSVTSAALLRANPAT